MAERVPREDFLAAVRVLPLVSIDLVVRDPERRVLLGRRVNRPARGSWFVPGGSVRKGERLADSFRRISRDELGRERSLDEARFLGVYEHHYRDHAGGEGVGTHYVVLGFELDWAAGEDLPSEQHEAWAWRTRDEALADREVHANARAYLLESPEQRVVAGP